jgi:DNA-directed RNA polymerase specialized sigma24 family protein
MKHRPMPRTSEQDAILHQGAIDGKSLADIARTIGRSETAIRSRARVLRITFPPSKPKQPLK